MSSELLTVGQAAERLGVSEHYVYTLASARRIRFLKLADGRRGLLRFRASDLDAFLVARTVEPRA